MHFLQKGCRSQRIGSPFRTHTLRLRRWTLKSNRRVRRIKNVHAANLPTWKMQTSCKLSFPSFPPNLNQCCSVRSAAREQQHQKFPLGRKLRPSLNAETVLVRRILIRARIDSTLEINPALQTRQKHPGCSNLEVREAKAGPRGTILRHIDGLTYRRLASCQRFPDKSNARQRPPNSVQKVFQNLPFPPILSKNTNPRCFTN